LSDENLALKVYEKIMKTREEDEMKKIELTIGLSGVIFRKALMNDDFYGVYSKVFEVVEKIPEDVFDSIFVLEILGQVGG